MFEPFVRKLLQEEKVKLRGSRRTKRLLKKRRKHFSELYPIYRDKLFIRRHGMGFMEWKAVKAKEKDQRFMEKYGLTYDQWREKKRNCNA